jgi:hypothetical protein
MTGAPDAPAHPLSATPAPHSDRKSRIRDFSQGLLDSSEPIASEAETLDRSGGGTLACKLSPGPLPEREFGMNFDQPLLHGRPLTQIRIHLGDLAEETSALSSKPGSPWGMSYGTL